MSNNLLGRIVHGRTDLVFDYVGSGYPATSADSRGVRLIQWCARYGDVSAIRFLVGHGESLDALGPNLGLDEAAFHGHWKLCAFLLEQGADVNQSTFDTGEVPLHATLCKPNRPAYDLVVEVLLAAGADPNRPAHAGVETGAFMRDCRTRGETPLHRAAAFGSERVIRALLDAGARLDAKDANGDSPLGWASWHTRPDAILRLLCYGEFRIHPDRNSTFDHGRGWGYMEIDLLGKPGAA